MVRAYAMDPPCLLNDTTIYHQPKIFSLIDTTQVSLFPDLFIDWAFLTEEAFFLFYN